MPKNETKKKPRKPRRKSIQKLQTLCDELNDRDDQIKKDLQLFDEFFSNFPIPVTLWSVDTKHQVLSKRGKSLACQAATSLENMFQCEKIQQLSLAKHEEAMKGNTVSYFVESDDKAFWVKLVPRKNDEGVMTSVVGIAWDITSNTTMLASLEQIALENDVKKANELAKKAISVSRLKPLLERERKGN